MDDELPHLGEVVIHAPEGNPESARSERHRRPLHEHREEDDHEHDSVQPSRAVDRSENGEGAEQDRDRTLQPAPDDEDALPAVQVDGSEERENAERARDERKDEREHEAVSPHAETAHLADADRHSERDEGADLSQAGERRVEVLDLSFSRC